MAKDVKNWILEVHLNKKEVQIGYGAFFAHGPVSSFEDLKGSQ
jgi:hypothetical protein